MSDERFQRALESYKGDYLAAEVLLKKYASECECTLDDVFDRIIRGLEEREGIKYGTKEEYKWLFDNRYLVPGGRILHAVGRNVRSSIANCYLIPIEDDSLESIFESVKWLAKTSAYAGGVGVVLDVLRPEGDAVDNSATCSTGPVSFMEIYSQTTGTIGQYHRRGALMIALSVEHPDIEAFISSKTGDTTKIQYANISVLVSDKFMEAVEKDEDFDLWYPSKCDEDEVLAYLGSNDFGFDFYSDVSEIGGIYQTFSDYVKGYFFDEAVISFKDLCFVIEKFEQRYQVGVICYGLTTPYRKPDFDFYVFLGPQGVEVRRKKVFKTVKARQLWDKIIESAHASAEPGVLFIDTIRKSEPCGYNMMGSIGTNPCGELPLNAWGCCLLSSLHLPSFVEDGELKRDELRKAAGVGVKFLNDVLDYGLMKHPIPFQSFFSYATRKIGLGLNGLADFLVKLGLRYGSEESVKKIEEVMEIIFEGAYETSISLAEKYGTFPLFDKDKHFNTIHPSQKYKGKEIFNASLLTVPPVGTGSIVMQSSSGIEPIFSISYDRKIKSVNGKEETFEVIAPVVKFLMEKDNLSKDQVLEKYKDILVTAYDITPEERIAVQAAVTKYLDEALSSTVNLKRDISVEDVRSIYELAYQFGCKGVTIYRDGSREGVLISKDTKEQKVKEYRQAIKELTQERCLNAKRYKVKLNNKNLYVIVSYGDDYKDIPLDVFISLGKTGEDYRAYLEAIGRLLSIAIQSGADVDRVINTLVGIRGRDVYFCNGDTYYSVPDAIGKILQQFRHSNGYSKKKKEVEMLECPECGEKTLMESGGCATCCNCGYSRCG